MAGEYDQFARDMRDRLDAVSPSLCLAKWQQVSIHLPSGLTQSCYHPPTHKIPLELLKSQPSVLHNTPIKIHERKQMLNGERPSGCSYCWKVEDATSDDAKGHLSDRHYRSSEWWNAPTFDEVTTNKFDYDVVPRYVEVNFNQACNFKCMYCNPYVEAFWEWFPEIYRKLRVFRMTGGEPLMDKNTFKVLDYVNENPHGQLELSITSNMCPPDQKLFDKFVDKVKAIETLRTYEDKENFNEHSGNNWYVDKGFKHFWLFVSLDGFGEQAEYMRTGLEFDRMLNNERTFLRSTKYSTVSFINTFNILSIPSLHKFLEMILELRKEFGGRSQVEFEISPEQTKIEKENDIVHKIYTQKKFQRVFFDIPILRFPNWFNIQNIGEYGITELERCLYYMEQNVQGDDYMETFEGFKPYELLKIKRDLAIMKESLPIDQQILNKKNFYMFITEMDRRRQTNFIETFPELKSYWKECIKAHTKH